MPHPLVLAAPLSPRATAMAAGAAAGAAATAAAAAAAAATAATSASTGATASATGGSAPPGSPASLCPARIDCAPPAPSLQASPEPTTPEGVATCRICFEKQGTAPGADPLVSPCRCTGSARHVHLSCLHSWQLTAAPLGLLCDEAGEARATLCGVCCAPYTHLAPREPRWQRWQRCSAPILRRLAPSLCFAALMLCATALFAAQIAPVPWLKAGMLLVATPKIREGVFRESVVLVTEHSPWGSSAVILNKDGGLGELEGGGFAGAAGAAHGIGGPLYRSHVTTVHDAGALLGGRMLAPGVFLGGALADAHTNATALASSRYLQLRGLARWAPRQLEGEIWRGGWLGINATAERVLPTTAEDKSALWARLRSEAQHPEHKQRLLRGAKPSAPTSSHEHDLIHTRYQHRGSEFRRLRNVEEEAGAEHARA
jgi:putative AlgH/UPF0301 family transcriptional regulator